MNLLFLVLDAVLALAYAVTRWLLGRRRSDDVPLPATE